MKWRIFKFNLNIHKYVKFAYVWRNFMVFVKYSVTHLHHKWCAHSILPLAPRAKQPVLHIHKCNARYVSPSDTLLYQHTHSTLGCGARPVSIGSRRRRAERTWHVVVSVLVQVRMARWVGGTLRHLNASETARMLRDATWANNAKRALVSM